MRIGSILTVATLLVSGSVSAQTYVVVPGQLPSVVRNIPSGAGDVTIAGEAKSADLQSLKLLPQSVVNLDISELKIEEGEIPSFTLMATGVRTLLLPRALNRIGEGAFAESALEEVTLPATVTDVAPRAFYKCCSLKNVTMGDCGIREIPEECFYGCSLLEEVVLPSGLRIVGDRAFMRCALSEVSVPGVVNIGDYAFAEMPHLSQVTLNSGAVAGEGAFYNDPNLGSLSALPQNSPVLGFAAGGSRTLPSVINSEIVEEGSFAGFQGETIIIGADVREINAHAFSNVRNLKTVNAVSKGDDTPVLDPDAFSGIDVGNVHLIVEIGKESSWREAEGWKEFIIEGMAGVADSSLDAAVSITVTSGNVCISSDAGLDAVAIYSLGGMVLFEKMDCGNDMTVGPFDEQEVIVRVSSGNRITVGKYTVK